MTVRAAWPLQAVAAAAVHQERFRARVDISSRAKKDTLTPIGFH
jgi:hypothetical protein